MKIQVESRRIEEQKETRKKKEVDKCRTIITKEDDEEAEGHVDEQLED